MFWRILESFVWLEIWLKAAVIGDIGNKGLNLPPFIGKPKKRTVWEFYISFIFNSNLALILAHPILSPSRKKKFLGIFESGEYADRILENFGKVLESFVSLEIWLKDAIIGNIGNKVWICRHLLARLKKEQFDRVESFIFKSNLALILGHPILSPSKKKKFLGIESGGYANRVENFRRVLESLLG